MKLTHKVGLFLAATFASVASFAQQAAIDVGPVVTEITNARTPLINVATAVIGISVIGLLLRRILRIIG